MKILNFARENEIDYIGEGRILFFDKDDYYINAGLGEEFVDLVGVISIDEYFTTVLRRSEPEYNVAKLLINLNLPEHIEDIIIDRFNLAKKKHLLHQDIIMKKKRDILQKYK